MARFETRELTQRESVQFREAVRELAWRWAQVCSGAPEPPVHPFDADVLDAPGQQAALLMLLRMLRRVGEEAEELIAATVAAAGATGVGGPAIGDALGVTGVRVRQRYPEAVAGRPGPRTAMPTLLGHEDWFGGPGDEVADRDWYARARVRLLQDCGTGGFGTPRVARVGEELAVVMSGRAGHWVSTDAWLSEDPPRQALMVEADPAVVEVLEVLEVISPWEGRTLELPGVATEQAL